MSILPSDGRFLNLTAENSLLLPEPSSPSSWRKGSPKAPEARFWTLTSGAGIWTAWSPSQRAGPLGSSAGAQRGWARNLGRAVTLRSERRDPLLQNGVPSTVLGNRSDAIEVFEEDAMGAVQDTSRKGQVRATGICGTNLDAATVLEAGDN